MTFLYFAASDSPNNQNYLYQAGAKNWLFSYNIVKNNERKFLSLFRRLKEEGKRIFLDSGAHTFQIEGGNKKVEVTTIEKYFRNYVRFLKKAQEYIDVYVELDIEDRVGLEKVIDWREEMETMGLNPLPVWHISRGIPEWKEYTKKYGYIGIGKFDKLPVNFLNGLLNVAKKNSTKVHGFGYTPTKRPLPVKRFYSIDSSSWLQGALYGKMKIFEGGKWISLPKSTLKIHYDNLGYFGALQWKKFADWLEAD